MSISFTVWGTPVPQGSKVRTRYSMRESNPNTMPWREAIISQIMRDHLENTLLEGPVQVRVTFFFQRPAAHYGTRKGEKYLKEGAPRYKMTAPDCDKLCRNLGDALQQSGVLRDDAQIVVWYAQKVYDDRPHMFVEVIPID